MIKGMVFIDGSWLYYNRRNLGRDHGNPNFQVDYGLLPKVLAEVVSERLYRTEVDLVRTFLFGSYAENYDLRDDAAVQDRLDFFAMLKEEYQYEVEAFHIDFRGKRLRRQDREPEDEFEPHEKCVDIALATAMLYYAAIPNAYDIAIAILGDRDFTPLLKAVRRLGKRTVIASIKGSCAPDYADPQDAAGVKDMGIIWLNDLVDRIELKYERQQLDCQSPLHRGPKKVWTTYRPRTGRPFYCDVCRERFTAEKAAVQAEFLAPENNRADSEEKAPPVLGRILAGLILKRIEDKGYGFIRGADGKDYFFHLTDLEPNLPWLEAQLGQRVVFEVKKEAQLDKAGAALRVQKASAPNGSQGQP